ncbi:unnamed protein product [Rotaria sordida]|uniref:Cystatin domain-containing protein n=1 Tax=Rotaria sordida TaxID=392033 RepID=A0A820LNX4_9BILA|nr:unnamed protein product [Rotaria sordida]CAF4360138.1 unnamed protein product [Rotaria sordida]
MFKLFAVFLGAMLLAVSYGGIPGGYTDRPELIEDPFVKSLTSFAAEYYAKKENIFLSRLKVTHVQTQIVAGVNYKLDFTGEIVSDISGKLATCNAVIYVRFDQTQSVTNIECH